VKDNPRDPLSGLERPNGKKRLSSAEVALLEFLAKGSPRRKRSARAQGDKAAA